MEAATQIYDITPEQLQLITLDLERLADAGLLVRVEVKGIHQFRRRAPWELFGVAAKDIRRQNITQGMIACWPVAQVKALESLEEQFRAHLDKYSHGIDWFAPWRFIRRGEGSRERPALSPFWTWRLDFEQLAAKLAALVAEMTSPEVYATARAEYADQMHVMAEEAWPAMERRLQLLAYLADDPTTIEIPDKETWMDQQVAKAMERFPSVETIRATVTATAYYQQIANPLAIAEMQTRLAEQRAQQAELDAVARAAQTREEIEREAIEQQILNSTVIQLLDLGDPLTCVLNETTADIFAQAVDTLELLRDGRRFQHSSKEKIRGWKPLYLLMSGDRNPAVERALNICTASLPPDGTKNVGPLISALQDLLDAARPAVEAMAGVRPEVWNGVLDRAEALGVHDVEELLAA